MRAGNLTAFLVERIGEEELLAEAFDDDAAVADCRNRRCVVQQGGRTVLRLLGLQYVDHQGPLPLDDVTPDQPGSRQLRLALAALVGPAGAI